MRDYEVVYIFNSALTEEQIEEKLGRYHGLVAGDGKGEVKVIDRWGRRQLAYPIRKQTAGHYVVAQFRTDPESLPEFERVLKLDEDLLRYLIVLHEGEPAAPMSIATREPRRVEEEEEGEEE
ncbi:MAG TPA: 30S ribosomal protein S6 [Longimicrobiales bacterium]